MSKIMKVIVGINTLAAHVYHNVLVNSKAGKPALDYLHNRKVSNKVINDYNLGFAPKDDVLLHVMRKHGFTNKQLLASGLFTTGKNTKLYDYFFKRIMYPIKNQDNQIIAFSGRVLNKATSNAKYLNTQETPVFHKGKTIFNLDKAAKSIKAHNSVILVEGYMDVLSAYQTDVKNVIASMGTSLTEDQINTIKEYTKNVTVCYDGDKPGQAAINRAMKLLKGTGISRSVIQMPKGIDPDEFRRQYGCQLFRKYMARNIEPPVLFKLNFMKQYLDMASITSQINYLSKAVKLLSHLKTGHLLNVCINNLSKAFHVRPESFRHDIHMNKAVYVRKNSWGKPSSNPLELTEQKLIHAVMAHPDLTKNIVPQNMSMTPAYIEMFNIIKYYYRKHHKINTKKIAYIMNNSNLSSSYHAIINLDTATNQQAVKGYFSDINHLSSIEYWYAHFNRSFKNAMHQGNITNALYFKNQITNAQHQLAQA